MSCLSVFCLPVMSGKKLAVDLPAHFHVCRGKYISNVVLKPTLLVRSYLQKGHQQLFRSSKDSTYIHTSATGWWLDRTIEEKQRVCDRSTYICTASSLFSLVFVTESFVGPPCVRTR